MTGWHWPRVYVHVLKELLAIICSCQSLQTQLQQRLPFCTETNLYNKHNTVY